MLVYFILILSILYVGGLIAFLWYLTRCVALRHRNNGRQIEFENNFRAMVADQQKSCKPSRSRNSKRSCDGDGDAWEIDHSAPESKRAKIDKFEFEDTRKRKKDRSQSRHRLKLDKPSSPVPAEVFQQVKVLITPNNVGAGDQVNVNGENVDGQIQNQNPQKEQLADDPTVAQRSDHFQPHGACGDCLEKIPSESSS